MLRMVIAFLMVGAITYFLGYGPVSEIALGFAGLFFVGCIFLWFIALLLRRLIRL